MKQMDIESDSEKIVKQANKPPKKIIHQKVNDNQNPIQN